MQTIEARESRPVTTGRFPQRAIHILMVDDNPADRRLVGEILKTAEVPNELQTVGDGGAALAYLRREGEYARAPRPDLILLDLNLPGRDGHEILGDLKRHKTFARIPVLVLSASRDPNDIRRAYDHFASCYVAKPAFLDEFIGVIRFIEDFWLRTATLPAR